MNEDMIEMQSKRLTMAGIEKSRKLAKERKEKEAHLKAFMDCGEHGEGGEML